MIKVFFSPINRYVAFIQGIRVEYLLSNLSSNFFSVSDREEIGTVTGFILGMDEVANDRFSPNWVTTDLQ